MGKPRQLCYQVLTLDREELLPAGACLTESTMEDLIRSGERRRFPSVRFIEHGTIALDLHRVFRHPPYDQMFSDSTRKEDVLTTIKRLELPRPLFDIYDYFKTYDPYTYRHILTVFVLSLLLAQDLIEDSKEFAREVMASPTHDFGKICVPLDVLKKATPLSENDQRLLSHHAAAGYVILSYYLRDPNHMAAITARDHHERRDGAGYPCGVALQDRVVEIVACGDVFDALISKRPYRPQSYDLRTALEEMTLQAGLGAFSTDVVHALIRTGRNAMAYETERYHSSEMQGTPPPGNRYRGIIPCRFEPACTGEEPESTETEHETTGIFAHPPEKVD